MKLGIRAHDIGTLPPKDLVDSLVEKGFHSIQLVLNKAIEYQTQMPKILDEELVEELSLFLNESHVEVAMLGAYFNPIHSDKEKVKDSVENFKNHLRKAHCFNTTLVGTETGSYNDDQWTFHESNGSEEAFLEVKRVFSQLLEVAKESNTYLAIEPAYQHVISTPRRLKRLIDELNHPNTVVTFDLFNLLSNENYKNQHRLIDEMVELFHDKSRIVHAKDFMVENQQIRQVAPGKGLLDYKYLLSKLEELDQEPTIIFEGVVGEDISYSQQYLLELLQS